MSTADTSGLSRRTDTMAIIKPGVGDTPVAEPQLFRNRELSWLAFNERVLEEARDASLPLFERLKFLGIVSSNLDEFFMIRVAGLKQRIFEKVTETSADGMLANEQIAAISARVHALVAAQDRLWGDELLPALAQNGLFVVKPEEFTPDQRAFAKNYFAVHVFPALTPLAKDNGVVIEREFPGEPTDVPGDRDELFQVFENLLENACKYGQSGGRVVVSVATGHDGPEPTVDVTVRDFGPGIAEEHIPRVTERFYRVEVEGSPSQKGTGLGLSIVKHILTRHNGRLAIRSRPGEGATFTVTLPSA